MGSEETIGHLSGKSNGNSNGYLNRYDERAVKDDDVHSNDGDESRKKRIAFSERSHTDGQRGAQDTRQNDEYGIDFRCADLVISKPRGLLTKLVIPEPFRFFDGTISF